MLPDFSDSDYDSADEFEGLRFAINNGEFECDDLEVQQLRVLRQLLCESAEASSHCTEEVGRNRNSQPAGIIESEKKDETLTSKDGKPV